MHRPRSSVRWLATVMPIVALLMTALAPVAASEPSPWSFTFELTCDGATVARKTASSPTQITARHQAGSTCTVTAEGRTPPRQVAEFKFTVTHGADVWARDTVYSGNGRAATRPFVLQEDEVTVDIGIETMPEKSVGTPLRLMAWNLWVGGTLNRLDPSGANLPQMIEYLNEVDPDILFVVEAYGSATKILDGLNAGRPPADRYEAIQITQPEDYSSNGDNLWLYTKLEIEKVYPRVDDPDLTSFNVGGARLGLPNGKHVHAFSVWTWHEGYAYGDAHAAAVENTHGFPRTKTNEQIEAGDLVRRAAQGRALLEKAIPGYVGDDDAPVLMGGDLNAFSHLDWTAQFANAGGHAGLVLDWPYTKMYTDAGFVDTFRHANPDAGRYPGRTWSPVHGFGAAPARIDYIFARGKDVRVLGSRKDVRRLARHQGIALDPAFPFYSDHGAVISDVLIRGNGTGPQRPTVAEQPEQAPELWPSPPAGNRIPPAELSATATTFEPGIGDPKNAVDGNLLTDYHSNYPEIAPQPHFITVDLQRVRRLSAVRFQPKLRVNMNGTILEGMIQVSDDGTTFRDVQPVEWPRMTAPNDVDLTGVSARYLRLRVDYGMGGASALAEIIPYEATQ